MTASRRVAALVAVALLAALLPAPASARSAPHRTFDLEAHRGGLGLRVESTLASFGNAVRLGVSTLELDVQVTEDGAAVVTHDRRVSGGKCVDTAPATQGDPEFPYVGRYVNTLTLAQVRTLDCGSKTLPSFPGQLAVPGSRMPLLRDVFALVLLMRMRQVAPELALVALTNIDFLQVGQPGASPWLGGIDIDDFGGDPIAAIRSFGAAAFSPVHGSPQNGKVTDPGYRPYVTAELVAHAHRNGITVIPWTVDDEATMRKLIDDGVDGIITDYPDRLRRVAAARGFKLPRGYASPFDIQGHRGARSFRPENTLAAFRYALANPDVSTVELDTGVTRDGQLVVLHDRTVNGSHCVDTAPVRPGDARYPYVGELVHDLTLAQLKTLDCGSRTRPEFPRQQAVPGERIPTLDEVFAAVRASGRTDVRLNIETKISPLVADTAPYREFTRLLVRAIERAGFVRRATIQSFDWRTIELARRLDPRIETVALVWQYGPVECASLADECSLRAVYGDPSVRSPWTAGLDWWRLRDLGRLVRAAGASTVSANWQVHDPDQPHVTSSDWYLRQDPTYFHGPTVPVLRARSQLKVVPYTVNDKPTMQHVIDLGVDGIITDDPDLLVLVARRNGLRRAPVRTVGNP